MAKHGLPSPCESASLFGERVVDRSKLPSVTEILNFVNPGAFDGIPSFYLERAKIRGTEVHSIAAAYLQGLFYEVPAELEGYHQSLQGWVGNFVQEICLVETELIAAGWDFRGHPDAIVVIRGDQGLTLVDWKTPKPLSKSWRLQLAGYRLLAEVNGHQIARVASLRLAADGGPAKFQGYSSTMAADRAVFLSALNVWKFFN
jgi:hypothetical protein